MARLLYRLGLFSARHPWRMVGLSLLVVGLIVGLSSAYGGVFNDNYKVPGSDSQTAMDRLAEKFPAFSGADARVLVHSEDGTVDAADLTEASEKLGELEGVAQVDSPLFSDDKDTALINVQYDVKVTEFKDSEGLDALEGATKSLKDDGYVVDFGGQVPENVSRPGGTGEMIGIAAAMIILLIAFGSIVAAGMPLLVAGIGLVTGLSGVALIAAVTDVSTFVPTMASMIGLGVGIDYALFVVTRYRQELRSGLSVPEAVARANATAGLSVVFAGATVLVALCGLLLAGLPVFASMGYAAAVVVFSVMLTAVTLLPAILRLLGLRILPKKARKQLADGDAEAVAPVPPRWVTGLAERVGRRPWPWALGAVAILLLLAAPMLSMRTWPSDVGAEPTSNTARRAYDRAAAEYGEGFNGPFLTVVNLEEVPESELPSIQQGLSDVDGVLSVAEPLISEDKTTAVINVTPEYGPQDERTPDLLANMRDATPDGVSIAGLSGIYSDINDILAKNLWKVILVVVGTSLLLLLMMFRSIVVPIKAAIMNLLSVGVAFGVLVAVFQWGWGATLLGLPHAVPVSSFLPVFMFAILFGLSMDYEVFLLSRVREKWLETKDAKGSVISGLSSTARVITSAALIMVAVFLGFGLDPFVVVKMMGVGLAAAILVDATIIRLILVPAVMALLGEKNWWIPRWLDRILPDLDPHSGEELAAEVAAGSVTKSSQALSR